MWLNVLLHPIKEYTSSRGVTVKAAAQRCETAGACFEMPSSLMRSPVKVMYHLWFTVCFLIKKQNLIWQRWLTNLEDFSVYSIRWCRWYKCLSFWCSRIIYGSRATTHMVWTRPLIWAMKCCQRWRNPLDWQTSRCRWKNLPMRIMGAATM